MFGPSTLQSKKKNRNCCIEESSKNKGLSIQTLIEKIEAVVFEKDDFEYPYFCFKSTFDILRKSGFQFRCREPFLWFREVKIPPQVKH